MEKKKLLEEIENKKRHGRIMQKRVIVCFFAAAVVIAALYGVFALWNSGWFTDEETAQKGGYIFEPNYSYEYDIMKDEEYLSILGSKPFISLKDARTGLTTSLLPEDYDKKGDAVTLLTGLVKAIQMGDTDTYNSYFSRGYLISEGKRKAAESDDPSKYANYTDEQYRELGLEDGFTMQQVYDVVITIISETEDSATDAKTYVCELKYKIRKNNATLRADMGSDSYREQEITMLENTKTGELEIITVNTYSSNISVQVVYGWRIALAVSVAVVVTAAAVTFAVIMLRKIGKTAEAEETEEDDGADGDPSEEEKE